MADSAKIINFDTVGDYNGLFGLEGLHPLVNVVDMSKATIHPKRFVANYGIYALFLKETKCGEIRYGRQTYDYQEGTIVSFAPGQVASVEIYENATPAALGVIFHPDLIRGTSLGDEIKTYSFFSYNSNEALHLSQDEKNILAECMKNIKSELLRPADKHGKTILARNIQLMLDYCMRFYERQFDTRSVSNKDVLAKFETLLDDYFTSNNAQTEGLPSVRYFAERVFLSPNYFGDLIKKETGKTAQEHIQSKLVGNAKQMIAGTSKTISQIAYELGFQYSQHFNRFFKKNVGCTPNEYRQQQ